METIITAFIIVIAVRFGFSILTQLGLAVYGFFHDILK